MNTHAITIKFENNYQTLPAKALEIDFSSAIVHNYGIINNQSYFLSVKHQQLNTILDLTGITAYQLIYFDENQNFSGASFSLGSQNHLFSIQTTAKHILMIPFEERINLEKLEEISIESMK